MKMYKRVLSRLLLLYILAGCIVVIITLTTLVKKEVRTSKYQAQYLSEISKQLSMELKPGRSSAIRYPDHGPYDQRLGYTLLADEIERLEQQGFGVTSQATISPMMARLVDEYGLFPIYHEKTQAGLRIVDHSGQTLFNATYPIHGYADFNAIPPLVLNTLLFIENRELLDKTHTTVNPAVEWDRLGFAALQMMAKKLGASINVPGGSTLATQLEKYRHSPDGYTVSMEEKLRQMGSASLRAYLQGPETLDMRRQIALSYLNSMPLAATAKLGEVHGLGDGLSAWFGADFAGVNKLLNPTEPISPQQALAYRQVLSILLSQRRPSYLLGSGFDALQKLTDSYLRILAEQGVISPELRDAALQVSVVRLPASEQTPTKFMVEQKTQNVLRTRLARTLGVKSNYELDRLDLTVKTTLDYNTQQAVTQALRQLSAPDKARAAGLLGTRMLNENIDLKPIVYSLMLFERGEQGNLLRIQTDNYDQPLDINEGIRIDLGSTAKLRTMVHYLELVAEIYQNYKGQSAQALSKVELHPRDYLSAWVIGQLRAQPNINLEDFLNQALDRRYSASPYEGFYTGGGVHSFNNFNSADNHKIMSVRDALRDSVNLVFIRLMRDLVYHHLYKPEGIARWLEIPDDPRRTEYLQRFADKEGQVYLRRFYDKYHGKPAEEIMELLTQRVFAKPSRLTMLYQAVYPDADVNALTAYLNRHLSGTALGGEDVEQLYYKYSPENFDLQDQGYITKVHPLELWLVSYLVRHPEATRAEVMAASAEQRQNVYRWLFKSNRKNAQQRRIMTLLENEAFQQIHTAWDHVGYPFGSLTPSYATSIGASGDRPAALAELMGILRNDGVRLPTVRFDNLHYAKATPYETVLDKLPEQGQQVLLPEVAKAARSALIGVVEGGTAGRLRGVYKSADNKPLSVGGKTGTGDHRRKIWRAGGRLIDTVFISRAAVFTFFLGDRFFGVITAYVEGPEAERYHFTSSVPVQIIKFLEPTLAPLLNKVPDKEHQPVVAESASDKKTEPTKSTKDTNNSSKDI
ncbi:MAG: transglycosylase domain-containing protein [Methylobacter sp.]|nr:transglycosylase domain-containing protein [Methylobacter sp.]MDP2430217.1 transglycosylase domain-containing protein [Methylobacter sp.]MDP3056152.1 transglycosylase domain-containing protein [Methylobacter sp.]MDP3364355.1 transglycosylase domain-containing protein [Methylobacter sp.]MDZ4217641.1 transglycosylase domain-containing protein [Methylobacter sp.]